MNTDQSHGKLKRCIGSWRVWMAPLLLGIPIAMAIGISLSFPTLFEQGYFHFHLYRTGFTLLARAIDHWAPGIIGFLCMLQWAFLAGNRWKGRAGKILRVALPLIATTATAGFCFMRFPAMRLPLQDWMRELLRIALPIVIHPITLSLLLALLLIVLVKIKRGSAAAPSLPSPRKPLFRRMLAGVLTIGALLCLLAYLGIHLAALTLTATAHRALSSRPNIIFIMADTLRADHVGCYGYDLPTTPNIDRFAREGTRFEHVMAQSSWTVWSVGSLMSSQYPETLFPRWVNQSQMLPYVSFFPSLYYPKLPEVLHDEGYSTNAIISNPYLKGHPTNTQGYDWYDDNSLNIVPTRATSPAVTTAACRRLQAIKEQRFFLYLLYMDPHAPYNNHAEFAFGDSAQDAARSRLVAQQYPAQAEARRKILRAYDSDVALTDHYIGQFLETLKREGLYDDALIVFFSDHGEEFLEHGEFGHLKTVYEEVIQVPLIIKLPRQRKGMVVRGTFPLLDLYPSVVQYAGIDTAPLGLQGQAAHLDSLLRSPERPLYAATVEGVQCVRSGAEKFIRTIDSAKMEQNLRAGKTAILPIRKLEAYDLVRDPREQQNRLPQASTAFAPLSTLLLTHDAVLRATEAKSTAGLHPFRREKTDPQADKALIERLKSLGYLNSGK